VKIDTTIHPGTLTATNTVSSVTLDWGASTDNLITYEVFRNDVFYVETSNLSYFDNTGDMIEKKNKARDNSSNYSGNVVSKGGSGGVN
jgi:hypothetical protein